jgi:hypothetical protein
MEQTLLMVGAKPVSTLPAFSRAKGLATSRPYQVAKLVLVINLRTAEALGLSFPPRRRGNGVRGRLTAIAHSRLWPTSAVVRVARSVSVSWRTSDVPVERPPYKPFLIFRKKELAVIMHHMFDIFHGDVLIGRSELESGDPPTGVAFGQFEPTPAFAPLRNAMKPAGSRGVGRGENPRAGTKQGGSHE